MIDRPAASRVLDEAAPKPVPEEAAANIERFLNNHTREGGRASAQNMVVRPSKWHPLPEPPAE